MGRGGERSGGQVAVFDRCDERLPASRREDQRRPLEVLGVADRHAGRVAVQDLDAAAAFVAAVRRLTPAVQGGGVRDDVFIHGVRSPLLSPSSGSVTL